MMMMEILLNLKMILLWHMLLQQLQLLQQQSPNRLQLHRLKQSHLYKDKKKEVEEAKRRLEKGLTALAEAGLEVAKLQQQLKDS